MYTWLYYLLSANLLEAGATDNDLLTLAWCLEQLTYEPILEDELARSASEAAGWYIDVFGLKVGEPDEHAVLLQDLNPESLLNSDTFEEAVKLAFGVFYP